MRLKIVVVVPLLSILLLPLPPAISTPEPRQSSVFKVLSRGSRCLYSLTTKSKTSEFLGLRSFELIRKLYF